MIRNPAVAGQFYPEAEKELSALIDSLAGRIPPKREDAIGMILPHAGYIYSGAVAASVVAAAFPRKRYVIIGPNHTALGQPFSMTASDAWKTPLGEIKVDRELAEKILKDCELIRKDEYAHIQEHSVEVQLPLIQRLAGPFTFVPLVVAPASVDVYRKIGSSLADSIRALGTEKDVVIIASSDMTHYEPKKIANEKDKKALEAVLKLDEGSLIERIKEFDITMCGFAPVAIMLAAAKSLGARKARLVKYRTSGDVTGDDSAVVGYAGIIVN